ncbi:hypothetical protein ACVWZ6_006363 [Bradyrhizobium sp. GM6.1]
MKTIRPQLRLSMPFIYARERRTPLITLTSKKRLQSSSGMSKKSLGSKMPALLMRMSTSGSAAASALQPAAVETSAAMPRTFPPAPSSLRTAASTLSWPRPLITTLAPEPARPLAMAWPMPAVEPVTRAVFPDRSMFMRDLR